MTNSTAARGWVSSRRKMDVVLRGDDLDLVDCVEGEGTNMRARLAGRARRVRQESVGFQVIS